MVTERSSPPTAPNRMRILFVEPFHSGSHAAFAATLMTGVDAEWQVLRMPGHHWKWTMRSAPARWALESADLLQGDWDLIWASSFTPLAELRGLVPSLARTPAILHFHENQLAYPTREPTQPARDLHYGVTQMTSCLAADLCLFNSEYNRDSFVAEARELLRRMPGKNPEAWADAIERRSVVLGLPLDLPRVPTNSLGESPSTDRSRGPVLLWNHRWEHDKDPKTWFDVVRALAERDVPYRVIVCGEQFRESPPEFEAARPWLGNRIVHWGFAPSREGYVELLRQSQIALSTARHEFFGIAMLEATHHGAHPLVPDRLVYPEQFPSEFRYRSEPELIERLAEACTAWSEGQLDLRADRRYLTDPHEKDRRLPHYRELIRQVATDGRTGGPAGLP